LTTSELWMLVTASEDGNPIQLLDRAKLARVLASPGDWGIDRFEGFDRLQQDHNYWPSDVGVLLRYEVVIPVPAGAYRLPDEIDEPQPAPGRHVPVSDSKCSCGWEVDGFTAPELARTKLFDSHIIPETGARLNGSFR
jgi:hypothetical protein